ncbi:hypothetical protein D6783_00480 [Candidatus Woesearchaeota archaeon]|nr:MAG: hypothetical protein D6783_00480 [Candidatus Woesearchaeota archaeon]
MPTLKIGLTGKNAAGKGAVAKILQELGFSYYSLSDILREHLAEEGKEITRDALIAKGTELREAQGSDYLAKEACKRIANQGDVVIDSIRNPSEVRSLRHLKNFILINIVADPDIRFKRLKARRREGDPTTYQTFLSLEKKEEASKNSAGQQLAACAALADETITNNGSLQALRTKVINTLKRHGKEIDERPDWDEYFLGIMHAVAKRATCDRGRSGCVITRDKRLLTTGYVGAPVGLPHCDEVGHLFKTVYDQKGNKKQHCIRTTHAEQNALIQAARHGISVEGATIYCTMTPCLDCTKMIINAGIKRVVAEKRYHADQQSLSFFKEAGIVVDILNDEVLTYKKQ